MEGVLPYFQPRTTDYTGQALQNIVATSQQNDQFNRELALRDKQQQTQADYYKGLMQNEQSKQQDSIDEQNAKVFLEKVYTPLAQVGKIEEATRAVSSLDPGTLRFARSLVSGRPVTDFDTANANTAKFSANQTGVAASGGTDPNAVNFATKRATGDFMPSYGFQQQQAADLQSRQQQTPQSGTSQTTAPTPTTPDLKKRIPAPSGNAVSDFEARATEAMPTSAQNQQAQTSITTTGMQQEGETKRESMRNASAERIAAGKIAAKNPAANDPAVNNFVGVARDIAIRGGDTQKYVASIPDKETRQAVAVELAKPENWAISSSTLTTQQRNDMASIDPLIMQAMRIGAAYQPYKTQNGLTDRDTKDYMLYRVGTKPPDDSPASQLATLEMFKVQAGSRLLKGGSRAIQALNIAMRHAPNGAIDTRAQVYSKTMDQLLPQLINVHNQSLNWGPGSAGAPPLGAMHVWPQTGLVGRWDGTGWRSVSPDMLENAGTDAQP